jgi:ribosomal protein S18 acetylase RimI-like enzyme/predicted GNAT family acetyltransferase
MAKGKKEGPPSLLAKNTDTHAMKMTLQTTADFSLQQLSTLLTGCYADYSVPVSFPLPVLSRMIRTQNVALDSSLCLVSDGLPVGAALLSRRGFRSRLAVMALLPEFRHSGQGTLLLSALLEKAQGLGHRSCCLEVIADNVPAVRLYEKLGFQTMRTLPGYTILPELSIKQTSTLSPERIECSQLAAEIMRAEEMELPWQISGATLATLDSDTEAYRLGKAMVAWTKRGETSHRLLSVFVPPKSRRKGEATRLLEVLFQKYPGIQWSIPPICPQEWSGFFEAMGFQKMEVEQKQMKIEWK